MESFFKHNVHRLKAVCLFVLVLFLAKFIFAAAFQLEASGSSETNILLRSRSSSLQSGQMKNDDTYSSFKLITPPPHLLVQPLTISDHLASDRSEVHFTCLVDDPVLWAERVRRNRNFLERTCDGTPIGNFRHPPQSMQKSIPVVFILKPNAQRDLVLLHMTLNTAAKFNDRVVLLLFGKVLDFKFRVAANVEIFEVGADENDHVSKVKNSFDNYEHHSRNGYEYEQFCFKRWFALLGYMEQFQLERVFVADSDVLILSNVTLEVDRCYQGCRTAGLRSFALFLGLEQVRDFTRYVYAFFQAKEFSSFLKVFRVVSDMNVQIQWFNEYYALHPEEYGCFHENQAHYPLVPRPPFFGVLGSYSTYFQDELGIPHVYLEGYSPYPASLLHFQGERKPKLEVCPLMNV